VATNQVVIVPILSKGETEKVTAASRALWEELRQAGVRAHLDERDVRPGVKYYDWELKGVPLRLELGMRDIDKGMVTFVRRDTGEKSLRDRTNVVAEVRDTLATVSRDMLARAQAELDSGVVTVESMDGLPEKIIRTGWCGGEDCGHEIEARSDRDILGTPVDDEKFKGSCVICGKPTQTPVYLARAM
jgi:prolyl-tRNA synthetase